MTIHGARLLKSLNIIITSWKWKIKKKNGAPQIKCIDVAKQGKIHCEKKKKKIISLLFTLQFVVSLLNPLTIDK